MRKVISFDSVVHQSEWMKIVNKTNDTVEIDIDGVIGGSWWEDEEQSHNNTVSKMKAELKAISEIKAKKIIANINSLGGDVNHGLAIHDLLAMHPAEVNTRIYGMTASIATVIAMAGNTVEMSDNALFLVHRGMYGLLGYFNQNELESYQENLDTIDEKIVDIYHKRTGTAKETIRELMDKDNGHGVWMNADEAKEFGFVNAIFEPMKAVAVHFTKDIKNHLNLPEYKPLNNDEMDYKTMLNELKAFISGLFPVAKVELDNPEGTLENLDIPTVPVEVQARLDEFETSLASYEAVNQDLRTENERITAEREAEVNTLNARIAELETELNKTAPPTKVEGLEGKEGEGLDLDPEKQAWDHEAQKIKNEFVEVRTEMNINDKLN